MSSIKLYKEEEVMKKEEDKQPAQIQESTGNAISDELLGLHYDHFSMRPNDWYRTLDYRKLLRALGV